jgi:Protein of unknown function (DUF433)
MDDRRSIGLARAAGSRALERLNEAFPGAKMNRTDNSRSVGVRDLGNFRGISLMQLRLTTEDRKYLEEVASRTVRPTKRQKAKALLGLASGDAPEHIAMDVGINKEDITALGRQFMEDGLRGVGLERSSRKPSDQSQRPRFATIEKTPGVCGGAARVAGTRIPVWQLVEARV